MMRLLIFLLFLNVSAACQNSAGWLQTLEGYIGKYPVTLHLHKAGNSYRGSYYYHSQQQPIIVFGEDTSVARNIKLISFSSPEDSEIFTFNIDGNTAKGTWKKNESSTALTFTAKVLPPDFTYVYTEGTKPLRPALNESPTAEYNAESVWPTGSTPTDQFLKKIIRNIFNSSYSGNDEIGALLLKDKKEFFASYLEENKDVTETDLKEMGFSFNHSLSHQLTICYRSSDILSLALFTHTYMGGAHGNYGTSYYSIDLNKNKKLTLSDIPQVKDRKKLNTLLEKKFREQYKLKPTDSLQEAGLFENKIEANDNFYITGKGIGFNYNPYEIGPYVMGEINIFISFSELAAAPGPTSRPSSFQAR